LRHQIFLPLFGQDRCLDRSAVAVPVAGCASGRPFAEVRRKLEATVPKLDLSIAEALSRGDQKRANDYEQTGPKLSIFGERDHGALLQIVGSRRNALQYEIGNPLTASKMTRHQLPAALNDGTRRVELAGIPSCIAHFPQHGFIEGTKGVQLIRRGEVDARDFIDYVPKQVTALHAVIDAAENRSDHISTVIALLARQAAKVGEQAGASLAV
jgi:hypothetical protein